jgi:hypothetical protein
VTPELFPGEIIPVIEEPVPELMVPPSIDDIN